MIWRSMVKRHNRSGSRSRDKLSIVAILLAIALMMAACGATDDSENGTEPADDPGGEEESADAAGEEEASDEEAAADEPEAEDEVFDFYDGETFTIMSPGSAGGGQDSSARFIAPYLEKHLDGDVTVVVDTKGGPALNFANEYELSVPHDGMMAMQGSGTLHTEWRFGGPNVRFDFATMEPLMSVPTGGVWFASPDTGIESHEDLLNEDLELYAAMISPVGGDGARLFMLREVLGVDVEPTFGYEGRSPALIAFEQGESNIDTQTATSYFDSVVPLVESGEAIPLFAYGQLQGSEVVRDPLWPDLPHVGEVYEDLYGESPEGLAWDVVRMQLAIINSMSRTMWIHEDAPEGALQALRAGFRRMAEDPEFIEEAVDHYGDYPMAVDEDVRALIRENLVNVDEEALAWFADYIFDEYGVELS